MNQNQQGCFAEYLFCATAMQYGFKVSMPLLNISPYDCLLEKNGLVFKIQIKYIGDKRMKTINNKYSEQLKLRNNGQPYKLKYVDFFAIYKEDDKGFYIIKNDGQKSLRLRNNGPYKKNFNNFALIS